MQITKKDVFWNFSATILKIASGVLILPLILRYLSADEVGIWTIFLSISAISFLLDFGFSQTFTRNITYIFSGVDNLQKSGYQIPENIDINFGLLKSTISAMKWFYKIIGSIVFVLLFFGGFLYLYFLLKRGYSEDVNIVYYAWGIYSIVISYQIYTLYYEALLQGRGLVKRSKQIIVISQVVFLVVSSILIIFTNWGLISLVVGQSCGVFVNRTLSIRVFYDKNIKEKLTNTTAISHKETLNNISPNAIKIGITSLGSYLVNRSSIFIGSMFIPLASIASFGITKQVIDLLASLAALWFSTYYPKLTYHRVRNEDHLIKQIYIQSKIVYFSFFILGGIILVTFGNFALDFINSKTFFLTNTLFILALIVAFLENNHAWAGNILLTKNEVPFFKASIFAGIITVILLFIFLKFTDFGLLSLIIAPGIAQLIYQNWKWPMVVNTELDIRMRDYKQIIFKLFNK